MQHITRHWFNTYIATHTPAQVNRMVGRALWVLFESQTLGEQITNNTTILNGVGFSAADAKRGSIHAKTYKKRGYLMDFQLEYWLEPTGNGGPRISKYRKQLNAAVGNKQAANTTLAGTSADIVTEATKRIEAVAYRAASRAG